MNKTTPVSEPSLLELLVPPAVGLIAALIGAYLVQALLLSAFGSLSEAGKARFRTALEKTAELIGEAIVMAFVFLFCFIVFYLVLPASTPRRLSDPKLLLCSAIAAVVTVVFSSGFKIFQKIWDTKTDIEHRIERGRAVGTLDEARRSLQAPNAEMPAPKPVLGSAGITRTLFQKLTRRDSSAD